jgi:putative ABC transport system permease protein
LKKTYDVSFFPGNLFDYYFLDQKSLTICLMTSCLAKPLAFLRALPFFIACLGLLGLALFATAQRTKEIGVRKVLGASIGNIVCCCQGFYPAGDHRFPHCLAHCLVHYASVAEDFAYRIDIEWWVFALAGILAVGAGSASGYKSGSGQPGQLRLAFRL